MKLKSQPFCGLSLYRVEQLQQQNGYNELPSAKKPSLIKSFFSILKEPMLVLLLLSGTIYFFLGEVSDALMLLTFVIVVITITFYQERKTENALEALKNLSSPRALVLREGQEVRIPGREVVVGDLIILREGDRVPADATILDAVNILVDESLLTGESINVRKTAWDGQQIIQPPGGDDLPFVFSGTLITQGHGLAKVTNIGAQTAMGKIGLALEAIKEEDSLLKKETNQMVKKFALLGIILCILIVVIYGLTQNNWIKGLLSGLTLSMAMLPEEFPVVLMIFLALGAWRISKKKVLTRNSQAIETLGAATVLCVDKTGTLTLNKMRLDALMVDHEYFNIAELKQNKLPEKFHLLMEYAFLASQKDPFDPIEKAIKKQAESLLAQTKHLHKNWKLIKGYPLSKDLLALSHVWQSRDRKKLMIAAKGAPEAIADLCHFSKQQVTTLQQNIKTMSNQGLRLLGVAYANFELADQLPTAQHDYNFQFLGLLGFTDPVRTTVRESLKSCYQAGIKVIMITGDYPGTAQFVANQIGLKNPNHYLTGAQLKNLNHLQLKEKIKNTSIFARVVPEQKLQIVNALKANGEIVAMTGDGVNDAPALKAAHIGIALGEKGTDVAREASDLVLLNDDFSAIVEATKLGRRIFDNLKKAMGYILAVHIPIAGMSLLPILLKLPVVLLPAHIAFLELIIDPSCSVVFEMEEAEAGLMDRPPRNLKDQLFNLQTLTISLLQGLSVFITVFFVFIFTLFKDKDITNATTITFITIVFANLMLILVNISTKENFWQLIKHRNPSLWYVMGGSLIALFLVTLVPFLKQLFHFADIHFIDWIVTALLAIFSVAWYEGFKKIKNLLAT